MARLHNSVKAYFRRTHGEVIRLCAAYINKPTPALLHDLRVNLKRIRFLRTLVRCYGSHKAQALFLPYQRLFRAAGEIRSYQMNRFRVAGRATAANARERDLVHRFCRRLPQMRESIRTAAATIERQISRTPLPSPSGFFDHMSHRVLKRLQPDMPAALLHNCRRRLKELLFCAELSPGLAQRLDRFFRMPAVAELEDKIGDWHDVALALRSRDLPAARRKKLAAQKKAKRRRIDQLLRQGLVT